MSFTEKAITLTFKLGQGTFGESGANTVTVKGLRVRAEIIQVGGATMGQANLMVWGLTPDLLNQLTMLWVLTQKTRFNSVIVAAGDADAMPVVFDGQISAAWADLNAIPNSLLHVVASSGYLDAVKPLAPSSFTGPVDVSWVMSSLANALDLTFENNGVSVILSRPYLYGTPRDQIRQAADAANIGWTIDNGTLAIWNKGAGRNGAPISVSRETGMVGYPAFNSTGISVTTLFNPSLRIGAQAKVESTIKPAAGVWYLQQISHNLESQTPGGQWFTHFQGVPPGGNYLAQ